MTTPARARKPKVPIPLEREIQASCLAILRGLNWTVYRRNVGGRKWTDKQGRERYMTFAEHGQSDVYGWTPDGKHVEVEVKRPGAWPTPTQIAWLQHVNYAGAIGFWVDSTEMLERIARHIMAGGTIVVEGTGQYRLVGGE